MNTNTQHNQLIFKCWNCDEETANPRFSKNNYPLCKACYDAIYPKLAAAVEEEAE